MIKMTFNGKPFTPESIEDFLVQGVADEVRETLGSIRHPETGEFPTIAITGSSLDDLQVQVEGSPELLELVKQRLAESDDNEQKVPDEESGPMPNVPKVFLSHAFEDKALARRIAHGLISKGIDTWFDEWCIGAGDSICQRVNEGLSGCTHFIVLLTPASITKPWVLQEMDAGLIRKLNTGSKFIALRHVLPASELPPLLQPMLSPELDAHNLDVGQLANDIFGVSRKPPLGVPPPSVELAKTANTGFSAAATGLAKLFVESTKQAKKFDPCYSLEELANKLSLSEDDVDDAIYELRGLVTKHSPDLVHPEEELFVRFDKYWMPWNPEEDALRVAAGMVNEEGFPQKPAEIAERFGWEPRRLNSALAFLAGRKLIRDIRAIDGGPWLLTDMLKIEATRRFVKSR